MNNHEKRPVQTKLNNITLIIPFRDEADNLPALIDSLSKLNLKAGDEIILIDDHSSDGGISSDFNVRSEIQILLSSVN